MAKAKAPAKKAPAKKAETSGATPASRSARQKAEERRWEASSDLDVLRRAEEVRQDPVRMRAARTESGRLQKALTRATQ